MYFIRASLDDSQECITTPDYESAIIAAKVFFYNNQWPIGIWIGKKLSYIFYEGVIYKKIGERG